MSVLILCMLLAQDVPLAAARVPDAELARQRGGFSLPNGIDVALTIQTQTSINGAIVLQTVFKADQGTPTLTVYAPKPGETVAGGTGAAGGTAAMPTVTYDSRTGITVVPAAGGPSVAIAAHPGSEAVAAGLAQVKAGTDAVTDNGIVSQISKGGLQTAELRAADLTITHLAGTAFGSAIVNSGSDRAIDTMTSVGIDLHNAGPTMAASAALRIEDMAGDAMLVRQ